MLYHYSDEYFTTDVSKLAVILFMQGIEKKHSRFSSNNRLSKKKTQRIIINHIKFDFCKKIYLVLATLTLVFFH